jgi:galactokinase/mevalonate kinase-like predicted kinase
VAAAYGGISLISVDYPRARRRAVPISAATLADLGRRMVTVWFGHGHHSFSMHDEVIARLASDESSVALDRIRDAAHLAAEALTHADVDAYAAALTLNHRAMIDLHPSLISDEAHELSELAAAHGAIGWKANGAAGPGGSMVLIGPADVDRVARLRIAIQSRSPWQCVDAPIASHGVIARRFSFGELEQIDRQRDIRRTGDLS